MAIGTLPPELFAEQQALNRQQQMAQLLMQQGQQMPQGQMVSGRYVAPSFFQNIAPLAQMYAGTRMAEKGDKQALELAAKLRTQQQTMGENYFNAISPQQTELAGPTSTGAPLSTVNQPDYRKAFSIASDPYAPSWLKSQAAEMLKPQKVGEGEKVIRFNPATGKNEVIAEGGEKFRAPLQSDTGRFIEYRDPKDPTIVLARTPKTISPADAIRMNFEGMIGGGMPTGAPMGNVPAGNMPMGATPSQPSKDKFTPAVQPQYQYNPAISPKLNQEAAAKFSEELNKNQKNAKDSFDLMKSASTLLSSEAPSSGRLSNIFTGTREFFGGGGEASKADARLNLLSGALTMKQPRFEGPQGVLDVILYQKLAGDLGNPNIPIASRLGTIEEMIDLQKKYYPEGDWDSISTKTKGETKTDAARSAGKVSVGAPQYAVNPTTGERIVSTDGGINWKPTGKK